MDKDFVLITVNEDDRTLDVESSLHPIDIAAVLMKTLELLAEEADNLEKSVKEGVFEI